jgi:hypothetical protein
MVSEMTFTSPDTNKTYQIIPTDEYGWFRYEIFDNGKKVQFALTEEQISSSVKHYELPGWDGIYSSRFD